MQDLAGEDTLRVKEGIWKGGISGSLHFISHSIPKSRGERDSRTV